MATSPVFVTLLTMFLAHAPVAHAINIQKIVSPRGITAWLVADHSNPIITVSFALKGAASLDPSNKRGLANLVASTLGRGGG